MAYMGACGRVGACGRDVGAYGRVWGHVEGLVAGCGGIWEGVRPMA